MKGGNEKKNERRIPFIQFGLRKGKGRGGNGQCFVLKKENENIDML